MKLQSMTDFVLEINKGDEDDIFIDYSKIINYAQFLKKPLNLGMFVPCVDGEPFNYSKHGNNKDYKQAKERVLFKCFNIENGEGNSKHSLFLANDKDEDISIRKDWENKWQFSVNTIEELSLLNLDIQLTESGIKQFM